MDKKHFIEKTERMAFRCTEIDRKIAEALARHYGYSLSELAALSIVETAQRTKDKTIAALLRERARQ